MICTVQVHTMYIRVSFTWSKIILLMDGSKNWTSFHWVLCMSWLMFELGLGDILVIMMKQRTWTWTSLNTQNDTKNSKDSVCPVHVHCTCPLKCQFCQFSTERLTTRQAYQKWYLRGLVYTKISYIDIWAVKIPQTTSISMMKCLRWIKKDVCLAQWICLSAYSSCWWNWKLSLTRAP